MPLSVRSSALTFLAFAMPVSMFGVMWPDVRDRFGQSLGALGTVSLVYGVARMSTSGLGRTATRRFGIGACFIVALVGLVASDLIVGSATSWPMFLGGVATIGVVSGFLDSVGAGVIATLGDVGSAGIIHGSYGIGATVGPLVVAAVPDWRWSLLVAAVVAGAALAVAVIARQAWPAPPTAARDTSVDALVGPPPLRPTVVSLTMFFAFVALEVTFGNWLFTYLTEARSIGDTVAAIGVSGFWGGTMIGRLALVSERVRLLADRAGMPVLAVAGIVFTLLTAVAPGSLVVVTTTLVGLSLSAIVPTLSARTADRVGTEHAQQVSGWQLLAANLGAIVIPFATGEIIDASSADATVVVVLVVFVIGLPTLVTARPAGSMLGSRTSH
ncbi:MAG: MFS transporter [Ilumatobacter sp.]|uniref:MFS transporter n=1 Tax=Ilumatobacter sp. TaxID=1967498 RepID=UPI00329A2347